jgi:hypothetical protein
VFAPLAASSEILMPAGRGAPTFCSVGTAQPERRWPANIRHCRRRTGRLLAAVAVTVVSLAGCSAIGPDAETAGSTAEVFHAAIAASDGVRGCALLAPRTVSALESDAGEPCAEALLEEDLPEALTVRTSEVYGVNAQVVMDGDVVFLATFSGRWFITAAGCEPSDNGPYDCTLEGG